MMTSTIFSIIEPRRKFPKHYPDKRKQIFFTLRVHGIVCAKEKPPAVLAPPFIVNLKGLVEIPRSQALHHTIPSVSLYYVNTIRIPIYSSKKNSKFYQKEKHGDKKRNTKANYIYLYI